MMNFYSVLLFFFIFGLFNVNSCDCCNGNKSSKSSSSAAKSGSPLIDISGRAIEELEKLLIIGVDEASRVEKSDVFVFVKFFGVIDVNLKNSLDVFLNQEKIRVFFLNIKGVGVDVIIFVSSDVVSQLGLDTNKAELHKLNDQIYYFYYFNGKGGIEVDNNDNVFANLDISNLKWYD